jgi:hypothetical protein
VVCDGASLLSVILDRCTVVVGSRLRDLEDLDYCGGALAVSLRGG